MPATSDPAPLAYSYLRFSTIEQAKGDSLRRQLELRDRWLAKSGAVLDTQLDLRAEGVSAYTGQHRKNPDRNALAAFLRQVEKGDVPRGSYLVLESLDRLTREHIRPALTLVLQLIDHGIRIVQLLPVETVYDEDVEPMTLMMAIMELSRGHSESRMKSERIGQSWGARKKKARAGELLATKNVPGWLTVRNGKVVTVPARVKVVKRVYRLATEGASIVSICKALNREKVPTFGRSATWNPSTVQKVLRGREAVGEYQPGRLVTEKRVKGNEAYTVKVRRPDGDPVPDYYPAVLTDAEWWAAQGAVNSRKTGNGRPTKDFWNPFAGLLTCARDRTPVYLLHQGKRRAAAFVSRRALKGDDGGPTRYVSFPADPFVSEVLDRLREIDVKDVVADMGSTEKEVLAIGAQRANTAARIAALRAELEDGTGEVKAAVAALAKLEEREEQLAAELARARARGASPVAEAWTEARSLIAAMRTAADPGEVQGRIKSAVRRCVESVWVLFVALADKSRVAAVQLNLHGGKRRNYLLYHRPAVKNQHGADRKARTWCRSFVEAGIGDELDLRDRDHAAGLDVVLNAADPKVLAGP